MLLKNSEEERKIRDQRKLKKSYVWGAFKSKAK